MRRGVWHQFGDRSQRIVLEQLEHGIGEGVIISSRDLSFENAIDYAERYHALGAHVLIDPQYYVPNFINGKLDSYPLSQYRSTISQLRRITNLEYVGIENDLRTINSNLRADGIIAPALIYEAGRPDIVELNRQLFNISKKVGDEIGVPTYATVILGNSTIATDVVIQQTLSQATAVDSDGWYIGFEFNQERIPSSRDEVVRCCKAGLTLACTGKPVLHSCSGPMSLLSLAFGSTGAGIGHWPNLWRFTRSRYSSSGKNQGGGGAAPPRFFSTNLWGTIIYPDEVAVLPQRLRNQVLTHSPFSDSIGRRVDIPWSRWEANKHVIYSIGSVIASLAENNDPRECALAAISVLDNAILLHQEITRFGLMLRDDSNSYQQAWRDAAQELLDNHADDFDYMTLLR